MLLLGRHHLPQHEAEQHREFRGIRRHRHCGDKTRHCSPLVDVLHAQRCPRFITAYAVRARWRGRQIHPSFDKDVPQRPLDLWAFRDGFPILKTRRPSLRRRWQRRMVKDDHVDRYGHPGCGRPSDQQCVLSNLRYTSASSQRC